MADSDQDSTTNVNRSGGADLNTQGDITIGGDVVGRDKIVSNIYTGDQQYDVRGLANPYLGLQSFTYADHAKYAGRDKLIAETVTHLTAPGDPLTLLFVTGASGSGKSSFVQAGVLPALEKHYAALNLKWAVFRPSRDPLAALSDAMWRQLGLPQYDASADFGDFLKTHTPAQQVNVIVIDQFEELFTQSNAQPRDALFNLLTQLPPFRSTRTHIIATVRADYLPELFAQPALYDIAKRGIDLRAMSEDELREAIQQPLRATYPDKDRRFQPELVDRLAKDTAEDAAYLPLLQVTLEEAWRKGTLTLGSYTNLADAIKQRADKVLVYRDYDATQPSQVRTADEQATIIGLCLSLVDVSLSDEARRDVRRRRSKDELTSGASERARLIDTLAQARLLSISTDSDEPTHVEVDLIHETLLSNWDRLRQAITERRHELRQRVRFEQQLNEWIGQDQSNDYLLSGVHLAEARELERRADIALHTANAQDFIRLSIDREDARRQKELSDARKLAEETEARREAEEKRAREAEQAARRLRTRSRIAIGIGLAALVAAGVAIILGVQAQQQLRLARSRELAAQAAIQIHTHPDLALLLGIEANRASDSYESRDSLLRALTNNSPRLITQLFGHTGPVLSVAFSPDREVLASGSADAIVQLWDVSDPKAPRPLGAPLVGHAAVVESVAFSPDGKLLASGSHDKTIRLWDVSVPTAPRFLSELAGHTSFVSSVTFSPDSKLLASAGADTTVRLWDVSNSSTPKLVSILSEHTSWIQSAAFSPDGKMLATGSCGDYLGPCSPQFGKDEVLLWDVSNPHAPRLLSNLDTHAESLAFSRDGRQLAVGNGSTTVEVWDIHDPSAPRMKVGLPGHAGGVRSLAFSPDGTLLASGGVDRTVRLWNMGDADAPQPIGDLLTGFTDVVWSVAFSRDGKTLASGSNDISGIRLWDVSDPDIHRALGSSVPIKMNLLWDAAFSPDNKTLAVVGCNNGNQSQFDAGCAQDETQLWDISDINAPRQLGEPLPGKVNDLYEKSASVSFNMDGRLLAVGGCSRFTPSVCSEGEVLLWNVSDLQAPSLADRPLVDQFGPVHDVVFSPNTQVLVAVSTWPDRYNTTLWDVNDPNATRLISNTVGFADDAASATFASSGKTLAIAGCQTSMQGVGCSPIVRLWSLDNSNMPRQLSEIATNVVYGHAFIPAIAFSPDDGTLAVAGCGDNCVRSNGQLWDVRSPSAPRRIGNLSTEPMGMITSVAFSPKGKLLASGGCSSGGFAWGCPQGLTQLWDVANPGVPRPLGDSFTDYKGTVWRVEFSPDGRIIASLTNTALVLRPVTPEKWIEHSCQIIGRNFTQAEWAQYFPNEPYRKTCEQWPLEPEASSTPTP